MHVAIGETGESRWVRQTTMSFTLLAVILAAPLLLNMMEKGRTGQMRPAIYPVSAGVRAAVWEYIDSHPDLELIVMARHSVEPDTGIIIMVTTAGPLDPAVKEELIRIVREARGDRNATVRVFTLLEAPLSES